MVADSGNELEEQKKEAKEWARFLYKLYREHPEMVALVLDGDQ